MSNTSFTLAYGCVLVAALLPMFCALLAKAGAMPRGGNRDPRAWLAAFIVLRLAYIALYVGDKAMARSLVWGLGLAVNIAILLLGWR
jgi:uncharacterized MAPEG superfamily protein